MRKLILALTLFTIAFHTTEAQSVYGKWKTIDDSTKEAKSIVEIYEQKGKVYAKVVDLLDEEKNKEL